MKDIKAVLKVFQTGAITITAPSVNNVQMAVERIYPLVHEYRKPKPPKTQTSNNMGIKSKHKSKNPSKFVAEEVESESEFILEEIESMDESEEDTNEDDYLDKSD